MTCGPICHGRRKTIRNEYFLPACSIATNGLPYPQRGEKEDRELGLEAEVGLRRVARMLEGRVAEGTPRCPA